MDGLRSINKRRRAFRAQPMKASRRKFALGGLATNPYEDPYSQTTASISRTSSTDDDTRSALSGDMVERTDIPRGGGYGDGGRIPPGKGDRQHPVGKALGKPGLKGYQTGGGVYGRAYDEDEEDETLKPPSAIAPGLDPTSGATVGRVQYDANAGLRPTPPAGYQGEMSGPPPLPDPQELRRRQSVLRGGTAAVPPSAPGTFGTPPAGATAEPVTEAQTGVSLLPPPAPPPEQTPLEKAFGLRAGSKRTDVTGSPGVTKYRDAAGKTLYSNVDYDVKGAAPTPEMVKEAQGRAKADSDRLTGLVAARAASGDPRDIEMARNLAVTPEQRMLVADAENMAGLRSRARSGDRSAVLELQGRQAAQLEGLRGQKALQVAMLNRTPTPLELANYGLAKTASERAGRTEDRAAAQEQRTNNLKLVNDTIEGNFTSDDRGKAEAADFRQNLTATLPHLKGTGGDLSKIDPNTLSILFSLNALRKNASPGSISQFFGADPASKNLLDFVPKSPEASFWRTKIRTPQGVNTLGELAGGRKDLKDFIAKLLAQRGVGGG